MNARLATRVLAFAVSAACASTGMAQETMPVMQMPAHQGHAKHAQATKPPVPPAAPKTNHASHAMQMPSMRAENEPAGGRSPDYSDGYAYGSMVGVDMRDDPAVGMLLLDRLEYVHSRDGGGATAVDGEAWYGKNLDKLWLKFEGEHAEGHWQDLRT